MFKLKMADAPIPNKELPHHERRAQISKKDLSVKKRIDKELDSMAFHSKARFEQIYRVEMPPFLLPECGQFFNKNHHGGGVLLFSEDEKDEYERMRKFFVEFDKLLDLLKNDDLMDLEIVYDTTKKIYQLSAQFMNGFYHKCVECYIIQNTSRSASKKLLLALISCNKGEDGKEFKKQIMTLIKRFLG